MPNQLNFASLTPAWLTAALRHSGRPDVARGRITSLRNLGLNRSATSTFCYLAVHWSSDAPESAPNRLCIKLGQSDRPDEIPREVQVYRQAMRGNEQPYLVTCYLAETWEGTGKYLLVLEDLSETHRVSDVPLPPTASDLMAMVRTLACVHATWWDHPDLGRTAGIWLEEFAYRRLMAGVRCQVAALTTILQDRLVSPAVVQLSQLADHFDPWRDRLNSRRNLTQVHGDAHALNFLVGQRAEAATYLIDWNPPHWMPSVNLGASDLVNLLIRCVSCDRRASIVAPVVEQYYAHLIEFGVTGYDWDELQADFRLALKTCFPPLIQQALFAQDGSWLSSLEHALIACQELA